MGTPNGAPIAHLSTEELFNFLRQIIKELFNRYLDRNKPAKRTLDDIRDTTFFRQKDYATIYIEFEAYERIGEHFFKDTSVHFMTYLKDFEAQQRLADFLDWHDVVFKMGSLEKAKNRNDNEHIYEYDIQKRAEFLKKHQ